METIIKSSDVNCDIILAREIKEELLNEDDDHLETNDEMSSNVRIVDISHDTTKDSEDNEETFDDCLRAANSSVSCADLSDPLWCKEAIESASLDIIGETGAGGPAIPDPLLTMAQNNLDSRIPEELAALDSLLTSLQDDHDNSRSLVQETYQSYRAILEESMTSVLTQLEARHHKSELDIMERMEQVEMARRQIQVAVFKPGPERQRLEEVLMQMEQIGGRNKELKQSLAWETDKEAFSRAVRENFGQFSEDRSKKLSMEQRSPRLLVSEHGMNSKESLVSALLSPSPVPGPAPHCLTPGLLSLGPLSPLSPSPVSPLGPHTRSVSGSGHGPIGSGLTSPAHYRSHSGLGLSQPDLSLSPRHKMESSALTGSQASSNLEYNLSQLAGTGQTRPGFTLADLISNVTDEPGPGWDNEHAHRPPPHPNNALSNLTALAKLDNPVSGWPAPDPNLLLPEAGLEAVSPSHQSLSPVLGMGVRGASPMSPIDSLMPGLTGLNISTGLLRSSSNTLSSLGQRSLNSMQIRCKFGQLGPGKGQFNSPHGFCLGVEEEIVVADTNNHRIQVFEKNGTYRYQFGIAGKEEGQLWYPRKVAVMKSTGKFVVCDRGNERSRMQIFTKHGHFVRKIAIRYIDIVAGLAITRDGNIVAVDSVTPTIFVIMEHGELLRWFDCADYMREPSDIAVSGREFYVCDFKGHNVVVFSEEGQFVRRIGGENITNFPNGIDISDAGDILIGDSHGNKFHVVVFANDGSLLGEFECPHVKVSRCCGLKITSEGYVVTLAKNNHHVLVLNTLYIA